MAFAASSKWQYKCPFRKTWVDVSQEEDLQLKDAYIKIRKGGGPVAVCKVGTVKFSTDFRNLLRTNLASRRSMEVRLQGGELPFPAPSPESGQEGPSQASQGLEEGLAAERIAPADLDAGSAGPKVPNFIRKAWGQGCENVTLSGRFAFSMEASDKDMLGEILSYHMLCAGVTPQALDNRCLIFTNKKGETAVANKEDVARMLSNPSSYPIRVSYEPRTAFKGVAGDREVLNHHISRVFLKFIKDAVAEIGSINNVKHQHQRRTFERYLLYLSDHYYQSEDDLSDAMGLDEVCAAFPGVGKAFLLTDKTGPGLPKILRGEIDVLEYLFGS
eukprot:TRINITY_DN42338_c0_g1_i1.p1 TRINITY_DN42338_c0_g1~~TRINITY_DN42338_c0_g1_i1.p1  ORF type:complete len:330 (+),score=56.27 TRINITY_DN42338_c0_g1_i1:33-1022(+)